MYPLRVYYTLFVLMHPDRTSIVPYLCNMYPICVKCTLYVNCTLSVLNVPYLREMHQMYLVRVDCTHSVSTVPYLCKIYTLSINCTLSVLNVPSHALHNVFSHALTKHIVCAIKWLLKKHVNHRTYHPLVDYNASLSYRNPKSYINVRVHLSSFPPFLRSHRLNFMEAMRTWHAVCT